MSVWATATGRNLPELAIQRDRYVGAIRRIFPHAKWRNIDYMLWEMTAWPVCGNAEAIKQLEDIRRECGPDNKHGWWRKVCRMSDRLEQAMRAENRRNLIEMGILN